MTGFLRNWQFLKLTLSFSRKLSLRDGEVLGAWVEQQWSHWMGPRKGVTGRRQGKSQSMVGGKRSRSPEVMTWPRPLYSEHGNHWAHRIRWGWGRMASPLSAFRNPPDVDLNAKIRVSQIIWGNYDYFCSILGHTVVARKRGTPGNPNLHPIGRESLFFSTWFPRNFQLKWCKTSFLCVEARYPGDHHAGDAPTRSTVLSYVLCRGTVLPHIEPVMFPDSSNSTGTSFLSLERSNIGDAEKAKIYKDGTGKTRAILNRLSAA